MVKEELPWLRTINAQHDVAEGDIALAFTKLPFTAEYTTGFLLNPTSVLFIDVYVYLASYHWYVSHRFFPLPC